jgi:hypothetical protein
MEFLVAKVHFVNGDVMEIPLTFGYLERVALLKDQGFEGKELVHRLLSDDWATPPATVELVGETADGAVVGLVIPYE